jgi:hypothetical protein
MQLENIGSEICEPIGGTGVVLYWGLLNDFDTLQDVKSICSDSGDAAANFTELAEISADHVMKAGKKLYKVEFTVETGAIVTTQIGEKGRRLFENSLTVEIPGSEAKLLGFARYIKNQKLICFVQEAGSARYRQLGNARIPAWVETNEGGLEATIEGKNAMTITFKDKAMGPAPIYSGELDSLVATDSE